MEDEAEDSEDEEYQQLGRNWLMVHEYVKLQRFQTFIIWLFLVVFFSFLFLSYKPEVVNLSNSSDPRLEKNALRAMEAGGRTSVAAAYEAMAAKEAMNPRWQPTGVVLPTLLLVAVGDKNEIL